MSDAPYHKKYPEKKVPYLKKNTAALIWLTCAIAKGIPSWRLKALKIDLSVTQHAAVWLFRPNNNIGLDPRNPMLGFIQTKNFGAKSS